MNTQARVTTWNKETPAHNGLMKQQGYSDKLIIGLKQNIWKQLGNTPLTWQGENRTRTETKAYSYQKWQELKTTWHKSSDERQAERLSSMFGLIWRHIWSKEFQHFLRESKSLFHEFNQNVCNFWLWTQLVESRGGFDDLGPKKKKVTQICHYILL